MAAMLLSFVPLLLLISPLLVQCAPQAHELTSSSRRLGPRYQILQEYVLAGQKNVRYETRPMSYQDTHGNPMDAAKFVGKDSGCIDVEGKMQPNGAEYLRPNGHFQYKCVDGNEEVLACIGSDRTNKAHIAVGQSLDIDGYWHKCEKHPNGSVIYTQASSCTTGTKNYRVGEEILVGNLRMVCGDQGYSVAGCYFYNNGQVQKLNPGEERKIGSVTHVCEVKGNTLQYYSKGARGCVKAGKDFAEGEEYSANHLRYKCLNGAMEVTGCYIDEGRELPVNQDVVEKNMVHRCYRLGAKVEYTEYACGFNGTPSCKPEPIPQTADQIPALGRGLISPGFGAFSVVETEPGSQNVKHPSTVNLQLQKSPMMAQQPMV